MWWGFWDGLRRGRVRICCKGAPGRDRWREEARNINVSLSEPRHDRGLCNRFGQSAPPRGRENVRRGRPGPDGDHDEHPDDRTESAGTPPDARARHLTREIVT